MSLTKSDVTSKVHIKVGIPQNESLRFVNAFFDSVKAETEQSGLIKFSGFGNFLVKDKSKRKGRNPKNGETIYISERKVLRFKPSNVLKSEINKKNGFDR
jgi:integration host factor subunit alpha